VWIKTQLRCWLVSGIPYFCAGRHIYVVKSRAMLLQLPLLLHKTKRSGSVACIWDVLGSNFGSGQFARIKNFSVSFSLITYIKVPQSVPHFLVIYCSWSSSNLTRRWITFELNGVLLNKCQNSWRSVVVLHYSGVCVCVCNLWYLTLFSHFEDCMRNVPFFGLSA
jgi:hypothetical protein